MAAEFRVPGLGENVPEGEVIKVLVNIGDTVAVDQVVAEVEAGKSTVELQSTVAGKIVSLNAKVGQKLKVNEVVLVTDGAGAPAAPAPAPVAPAPAPAAPAPAPAPAASSGGNGHSHAPAAPAQVALPTLVAPAPMPANEGGRLPAFAAPSVRQFAREIGLDVAIVPGSGPGGRISTDDVKRHARNVILSGGGGGGRTVALPDFTKFGATTREPMNAVRQKTVEHMANCWATVPAVTQHDKADVTSLEALRKQFGAKAEKAGGKLTMTAILIKIVAVALKNFPKFNASIDVAKKEVVFKQYCNIGIAVDTERGLLVPVVKNADQKNIIELAGELGKISEKARARKLGGDDLSGGTFTISNLGGLGGKHFSPIVNLPEVAILGVGRAALEPVYVDGKLETRLMMPLSLTYDHRLIDGADGTRYLRWVVEACESPFLMSLEG